MYYPTVPGVDLTWNLLEYSFMTCVCRCLHRPEDGMDLLELEAVLDIKTNLVILKTKLI